MRQDAPPRQTKRGRFIVLDGIDGCGKTTQARRLVRALAGTGSAAAEPLHVREPGSTPLGEALRALLLSRDHDLDASVEALLLVTARRHMLERLVRPALAEGRDVVCERFHPSTYAYQGVAGELGEELVLELLQAWAGDPAPDKVIVLDLPPETAAARAGAPGDRIEDKGLAFQRRVADGYRRYAERVAGTVVVDGSREPDEVERDVLREVRRER